MTHVRVAVERNTNSAVDENKVKEVRTWLN